MVEDEIDVEYELEGTVYSLNPWLVRDKCLTQEEVDKIKSLHIERLMVEKQLEYVSTKDDIRAWYKVWEQIQFDLQKAWGFPKDRTFHPSHRLSVCSCPKLDNDERIGTKYQDRNTNCKLHNALNKEKVK